MPNEALQTELNIDPDRFDIVFSQVWDDDENPEDRVHIITEVETEILNLVDDWTDQIHDASSRDGAGDGLFLVIEGAQATGKTTMTRYISNNLDPVKNPDRSNIPIVIPVWDSTTPNPSPLHYRQRIQSEGRKVFQDLEVPDIEKKTNALNGMGVEFDDDQLAEWGRSANVNAEQVKTILGQAVSGGEEYEAKEVMKSLAQDGYFFIFVFDEMVSENDANEAKSVLKWFKDHLYPYVGLVLFCHPDVSSAIKSEMQDQATRRNIDHRLEIAGETYDIKEDIVINIRGKQDQIIDLSKLLQNYFSEVYLDEAHPDFGPLDEANIDWMKSLLGAGGLIGNLIDGVNKAIQDYAEDRSEGNEQKRIGTYLFDECGRKMRHVQIKQRFEAHSDLDPTESSETVWRAKELITQSIKISDLSDSETEELLDVRVLIQEPNSDEIELNPSLIKYEEADISITSNNSTSSEPGTDELATYNETIQRFSDEKASDREALRGNLDVAISSLIERINSQRINIASSCKLALPGEESPASDYVELVRHSTDGRAEKLEVEDGELSGYGYRYLVTSLFNDESLSDPDLKDEIQSWFGKDNGIIIVTNKDEVDEPDWFEDKIGRQQWRDNEYTWGEITQIVYVDRLRELMGIYRHLQEQDPENDSEALTEIERLSNLPGKFDVHELIKTLYEDSSKAVKDIHDNIYGKYDGPKIQEAEAFVAVLEEIKDNGFISNEDLDELRDDYGVELESLSDKDALKKFTTDGGTVIYLKEDFGSASKVSRVGDSRDLFPVGPSVFEQLSEFREMEDGRVQRGDDEISDKLDDLENKIELIDFFIYDDGKLSDIQETIDDTDINVFGDLESKISTAKGVDKEDFELVREQFQTDKQLWEKIQKLDVDDGISPIHRALFYAKLPKQPPSWAEEYLDDDRDYPSLIYTIHTDTKRVLDEIDETNDEVASGFENDSEDLENLRDDLEDFVGIELDGDDIDINESNSEEVAKLSNDDLKDFDFESLIHEIAENQTKRSNIGRASGHLTRADGARENFLEEFKYDSLDEIDYDQAEDYLDVGQNIARKLLDDDVLFSDTDEPEIIVRDFKKFCKLIRKLLNDSKELSTLESRREELLGKVESIPGVDVNEKIQHLEDEEDDLETAQRYLKLKEEHCDVCKSEWEDLSSERRKEIKDELDRMESDYPGVTFSLDQIGGEIEQVADNKKEADEVRSNLEEVEEEIDNIDLSEITDKLDSLEQKYD